MICKGVEFGEIALNKQRLLDDLGILKWKRTRCNLLERESPNRKKCSHVIAVQRYIYKERSSCFLSLLIY